MTNIADKQAKLQNAMSRAKKLIQLESNGTLDKIANGVRDGISDSLNGGITTSELMSTPKTMTMSEQHGIRPFGPNASNVPAAIRESFAKKPIDTSSMYSDLGGNEDLSFLMENTKQKTTPTNVQSQNVRQIVSEGLGTQTQYASQGVQIDYPMIRTIVEDIVRKYTVSLKNKIIAENKDNSNNQLNTHTIGKTFKFLDSKGNLYECTMKKIGNVNNKKATL